MIIGSMVIINLFIGVIIDNFNKIKETEEFGVGLLVTPSQKQWIEVQEIMLKKNLKFNPLPPRNRIRLWCYKITNNLKFEIGITIVIILNTFVMAMRHSRMTKHYELVLENISYVFTFIYNVEFAMKFLAIGFKFFTIDSWNRFDFYCVCGADIGLIFQVFSITGKFWLFIL
jgi:hypothetical protein